MLHSARTASGTALSCALGFPISVLREGGSQDYPEKRTLRYGTYKVFRTLRAETPQDLPGLRDQTTFLEGSVASRLADPDFVRAFASGVLLVKPAGRPHHLNLTYVGFGWSRVDSFPTLSVARKICGWALSSPSTVHTIWGSSLRELSRMYSDQILWLRSNWRLLVNTRSNKKSNRQVVLDDWIGSGGLPRETREFFNRTNDPRVCVGHCRSGASQSKFQLWTMRCRSRVATAPTLKWGERT
jgi:hypothetical protein